jgi:hypothetical protein
VSGGQDDLMAFNTRMTKKGEKKEEREIERKNKAEDQAEACQ